MLTCHDAPAVSLTCHSVSGPSQELKLFIAKTTAPDHSHTTATAQSDFSKKTGKYQLTCHGLCRTGFTV